jgi:predicted transcriptional regulator
MHATTGDRHTVTMSNTMHGFNLGAGKKTLANDLKDNRKEAEFMAAVEELESLGLIVDKGHRREVFGVTKKGYTVLDELKRHGPIGLSVEGKNILLGATEGKDGQVMGSRTFEGFHLSAGGKSVCESDDDRVVASYEAALAELSQKGLLKQVGEDNYQITVAGYKAGEELRRIGVG